MGLFSRGWYLWARNVEMAQTAGQRIQVSAPAPMATVLVQIYFWTGSNIDKNEIRFARTIRVLKESVCTHNHHNLVAK